MSTVNPYLQTLTVQDFKNYFPDDFNVQYYLNSSGGNAIDDYINRAFTRAIYEINDSLFEDNNILKVGYFYLVAHYLVIALRNADLGIQSLSQQVMVKKKAKDIEADYGIPEYLLKEPLLNGYSRTTYGIEYLMMIASSLRGNIISLFNPAKP